MLTIRTAALLLLLAPALAAGAEKITLTSDTLASSAAYVEIMVDGAIAPECNLAAPCISGAPAVIDYDLTPHAGGPAPVTLEARACNTAGVCSAWSLPFVADLTPPAMPIGLRITVSIVIETGAQ